MGEALLKKQQQKLRTERKNTPWENQQKTSGGRRTPRVNAFRKERYGEKKFLVKHPSRTSKSTRVAQVPNGQRRRRNDGGFLLNTLRPL